MLEAFSSLIIHLIQTTGYLGIFVLMTLESALIPIPSEVTMPFAGFLVNQGSLNFYGVVLAGAFGNLVGSLIAFAIGFYLEEHVILKLVKKYGKFLLLTEHDYAKSVGWLKKYGDFVAFFSRMLPAVRTFISLPAGLSEMNIWKFSLFTFLGSLLWCTVLTYAGMYFGTKWHSLEPVYRKFELIIAVVFITGVLWFINHKLKIIKFRKK